MLNELYQLSKIMEKQGIMPQEPSSHRDIHKVGKAECLYLRLQPDGVPYTYRIISKADSGKLWVHSKGNHSRFPCFKIKEPLLAAHISAEFDEELWKKAKLEQMREVLSNLDYGEANAESRNIYIKPWTLEQLQGVMESKDRKLEALQRLIQRFPREYDQDFYSALRMFLKGKIHGLNEEELTFWKNLLVGTYDSKTRKFLSNCACYFDISELTKVSCPVANEQTERAVIRCLNAKKSEEGEKGQKNLKISALSGEMVEVIDDKFPNPNFPVIGPAYLYSNNVDIPCLERYGVQGVDAYPAGKEQVARMCNALDFLTDEARNKITWTRFPAPYGKNPMLLLVWMEDEVHYDTEIAEVIGGVGGTKMYESRCRLVLDLLRRERKVNPQLPAHLQFFEVLDKGRKQICLSEALTVSQLYHGISEWIEAAEDHVDVFYKVGFKRPKGKEVEYYRLFVPGPGAVSRLMRTKYRTRRGLAVGTLRDMYTSSLTLQQIYHLLIPDVFKISQEKKFLEDCLDKLLYQTGDLLMDAGGFQTTRTEQPFSENEMQMVTTGTSLVGILLYKLGYRRKAIMESSMFLLGRLLKLADKLHKNYCIVERNGETPEKWSKPIPTQLIGNSMVQMAAQNPLRALDCLGERMYLYVGWAEANEGVGNNHSYLRLIEKTLADISSQWEAGFPQRTTSKDRAELYIGYMAQLPK